MPDDLKSDQEPRIPEPRLHRDSETKSTTPRSSRSSFGEEEGDACDGDAGAGEEGIQGREGEIASTGATEDGHGVSSGGSPDGSGTGADEGSHTGPLVNSTAGLRPWLAFKQLVVANPGLSAGASKTSQFAGSDSGSSSRTLTAIVALPSRATALLTLNMGTTADSE